MQYLVIKGNSLIDMAPIFLSKLSGLLDEESGECDGNVEEHEVVSSTDEDATEHVFTGICKKKKITTTSTTNYTISMLTYYYILEIIQVSDH